MIINNAANVYIDGGADNDKVTLEGEVGNITVVGGKGNDTVTTNGQGNIIRYSNGDGKDVIFGFSGSDMVEVNCNRISSVKQSGTNTIFYIDSTATTNTITFRNTQASDLTYEYNEEKELYEIFIDTNIESSSSASIADVSEISSANYSVQNIETQNYNTLTQDSIGAAYSYSNDK